MVPQPVPDDEAGGRNGLQQLQDHLGDAYQELPLYAPAGTCVIYDISLYHSRVNAEVEDGKRNRRALQTYYSRGDVPALTNWVIVPKRLAESEDAATARFYSLQARAAQPLAGVFSRPLLSVVSFRAQCEVECQKEFAAGGYDASALSEKQQRALRVGHHAWEQPS